MTWPGLFNARDLGGIPTPYGVTIPRRLIRSDAPIAGMDAATRSAILEVGVRGYIDLRSVEESALEPSAFAGHSGYRLLPLLEEQDRLRARTSRDAAGFLQHLLANHRERIAAIMDGIDELSSAGPILIHCKVGKDRTGLIVALLLAIHEVSPADIAADYSASDTVFHDQLAAWSRAGRLPDNDTLEGMAKFVGGPAAMLAALDWLHGTHGSADAYLRAAGIDAPTLARLKVLLLGPRK
jgi:protein tyrosine/serine phosphatase